MIPLAGSSFVPIAVTTGSTCVPSMMPPGRMEVAGVTADSL
jgi:hypothetical protein